ncbi:dUTP diphosphatase [Glaciimonas sp. PAMC28666]|uniref:dUTP diphosphatase n=1 Tax=Glaciimonas sp. PAMC28666 TaxID=2807626 RepID=UPI0019640920|nr:dUTP diphosphatase [Glaciimonas sp. PAMC28666]QRX81416.1 dUTP diphosphatase [Glaciimonas sp. PAMC28666]
MKKISVEQAETILTLQDNINRKVDDHWLNSGYPYLRGVLVEAVEALDHYGWKWWSSAPRDLSQVQIELIDILHFSLSDLISECGGNLITATSVLLSRSDPELDECYFDGRAYAIADCDVPKLLELIAGVAGSGRNELPLLEVTFRACGLNWDQITVLYIAKHVLNVFRQNHGYKDGCYTKIWGDKEDNIHLVEIVSYLDPAAANFSMQIYGLLNERYAFYALARQPIICVKSVHADN